MISALLYRRMAADESDGDASCRCAMISRHSLIDGDAGWLGVDTPAARQRRFLIMHRSPGKIDLFFRRRRFFCRRNFITSPARPRHRRRY